jgi:hypothetical protein
MTGVLVQESKFQPHGFITQPESAVGFTARGAGSVIMLQNYATYSTVTYTRSQPSMLQQLQL